jgi:hypothetical protein
MDLRTVVDAWTRLRLPRARGMTPLGAELLAQSVGFPRSRGWTPGDATAL